MTQGHLSPSFIRNMYYNNCLVNKILDQIYKLVKNVIGIPL